MSKNIKSFFMAKSPAAAPIEVVEIVDSDSDIQSVAGGPSVPEPLPAPSPTEAPLPPAPVASGEEEIAAASVERKRKTTEAEDDEEPDVMVIDAPAAATPAPKANKKAKTASGTPASTKEASTPAPDPNAPPPKAAEVKDGKLVFKETKFNFAGIPHCMKEMLRFMEFRKSQTEAATVFPAEFLPLVGMLVQDRFWTKEALAKEILEKLCPNEEEDSQDPPPPAYLTQAQIADAILQVAEKKNYGVQRDTHAPHNLSILRWEVKDVDATFPKDVADRIRGRREKRVQAQADLKEWLDSLPEEEQKDVLQLAKKKKPAKGAAPGAAAGGSLAAPSPAPAAGPAAASGPASEGNSEKENLPTAAPAPLQNPASGTPAVPKKKKAPKEPKEPKEAKPPKEKKEPKVAAEKGKKAAPVANPNQRDMFSFFKKDTTKEKEVKAAAEIQFDKSFRPVDKKQDEHRAPTNFFRRDLGADFDDVIDAQTYDISVKDWLAHRQPRIGEKDLPTLRKKVGPIYKEVEGVVDLESEALKLVEIGRRKFQLLQFKSEVDYGIRPPFWGIFDKESKVVTGRRPFAKDVAVFDYDYESELEWEEEEEGEDLDSDEEDDDDRGSRTSMESDEEDDWLVEDDDRADESGVGTPRPSSPTGRKPKARRILDAVIIDTGYDDLFLGELAPNPKFIDFTGELVVDGGAWGIDPEHFLFPEGIDDFLGAATDAAGARTIYSGKQRGKKPTLFPDDKVKEMADFVNGSTLAVQNLINQLSTKFPDIPKRQIGHKLREIAESRKGSKPLWMIKPDVAKALAEGRPLPSVEASASPAGDVADERAAGVEENAMQVDKAGELSVV